MLLKKWGNLGARRLKSQGGSEDGRLWGSVCHLQSSLDAELVNSSCKGLGRKSFSFASWRSLPEGLACSAHRHENITDNSTLVTMAEFQWNCEF